MSTRRTVIFFEKVLPSGQEISVHIYEELRPGMYEPETETKSPYRLAVQYKNYEAYPPLILEDEYEEMMADIQPSWEIN